MLRKNLKSKLISKASDFLFIKKTARFFFFFKKHKFKTQNAEILRNISETLPG